MNTERANYRIKGNIVGQRGGAFQGIHEDNYPVFGGSNLIYAPIFWEKTYEEVQSVCNKLMAEFPNCIAKPDRLN